VQDEAIGEYQKLVTIVGDVVAFLHGACLLLSIDDFPSVTAGVHVVAKIFHWGINEASAIVLTCRRWRVVSVFTAKPAQGYP